MIAWDYCVDAMAHALIGAVIGALLRPYLEGRVLPRFQRRKEGRP